MRVYASAEMTLTDTNDGISVTGIDRYYMASSSSNGVTVGSQGWKPDPQETNPISRYHWSYEVVNYSDGAKIPSKPAVIGVYGKEGKEGIDAVTVSLSSEAHTFAGTESRAIASSITIDISAFKGNQRISTSIGTVTGGITGQLTHSELGRGTTSNKLVINATSSLAKGNGTLSIPIVADGRTFNKVFSWSVAFKGIPGKNGTDGTTTYTWIRYADTPTSGMDNSPLGKKYIGLAFNKTTQTESSNYNDYQWSLMPQNIDIGGRNLILNSQLVPTSPNNSGLGIAVLMKDESTPYYRLTGDRTISTYGFDGSATSSRFSEPMIDGTTYTVSVDVRAPRTGRVGFYSGKGTQSLLKANEWVRIKYTYTYSGTSFRVIGLSYDSSIIDYKNWKIEKGNTTTDWTPAPEDIEAAYTAVAQAKAEAEREKAEAYADDKVTAEEKARIKDANTKLAAAKKYAVDQILADKTIQDTRNDNETPAWYYTNHPRRTIKEFKLTSTIGVVSSEGTYGILETEIPWKDATGGPVKQTFRVNSKTFKRSGTTTSWSSWVSYDDIAETAKSDAATAKGIADGAAASASDANKLLVDIASDSKLTATEKKAAKKEWDIIVGEKPKIDISADNYGITTQKTAYNTAYNTLKNYLSGLLANLNTTSNIVGTTFRANFKAYYNARQDLLNKIADGAKSLVDEIEVGGRNLIVQQTITSGRYLNASNTPTADAQWFYTDYIPVSGYTKMVTSGYTNLGNSPSVVYYDSSKNFVRGINNGGQSRAKDITINSGEAFIRFSGMIRDLPTIKLEKGNKSTDWTPAPEDVEAAYTAVAQAKAEAERIIAESYADGKVSAEEKARIADANAKLTAAKQHAENINKVQDVGNGDKKFINVGSLGTKPSSATGYLVIKTPLTSPYMTKMKISGYNYRTGKTNIDISVSFYAFSNNTFHNYSFISSGNYSYNKVQLARDSSGKTVVIIGNQSDAYSYPKISIDEVLVTQGNPPNSFKDGFSAEIVTDISMYTNVVNIPGSDTQSQIDDTKEQVKKTVKTITEEYYQSTSETSQTGSDWTTTAPTWKEGKFIFIRSKITYVDDTTDYTPIVNITGAKGDTGEQGPPGIPGDKGADGQSQWVHIRYSPNPTGSGMTANPYSTTKYVGIAVTNSATAPAYPEFTWSKYVGENGAPGEPGLPGDKGDDGQTTYTWVRYADTPTSGMENFPDGKKYIGLAFNQTTQTESNDYSDYQWSLMPQNIEVGGRNLVLNSSTLEASGLGAVSGSRAEYQTINTGQSYMGLEDGETITISFDIEMKIAKENPSLQVYNSNVPGPVGIPNVSVGGQLQGDVGETINKRISLTTHATLRDTPRYSYNTLEFYSNYGSDNFFKISKLKVERGDVATDWTEAPEDTQAKINDKASAEDLINAENGLSTSIGDLSNTVDGKVDKSMYEEFLEHNADIQQQLSTSTANAQEDISKALARTATVEQKLGEGAADWIFTHTQIRMSDEGITLGEEGSGSYLQITNDQISFYNGSAEPVAFINGGMLNINHAIFVESIQISEFMFSSEAPGHLTLRYVGN